MYKEDFDLQNEKIIAYCFYCKSPILEGEGMICVNGKYYHYDLENRLNNCWFPEEQEDEE
jgi:hypothetical protein